MVQSVTTKEVSIEVTKQQMRGLLCLPQGAKGIVLFAHGSGSGRLSPRNQFVAQKLQEANLATLLLDLLTPEEEAIDEKTLAFRFDIDLLSERLVGATNWLHSRNETEHLRVGYFGASTGAAAALLAAADLGPHVQAVVSRGGRVDLAYNILSKLTASILLIVGGNDFGVLELNKKAYQAINGEKRLEIVAGATHLFEEPGALDTVASLASAWFTEHLK